VDWDDETTLGFLDLRESPPLRAIALGPQGPTQTHSRPAPLVCGDGQVYWCKGHAQQGLVVELIAGRLAHLVGVGGPSVTVDVAAQLLPEDGSLGHLVGNVVGTRHREDMVNARDLAVLLGGSSLSPDSLDHGSRACVIAFQSWLGIQDAQVMVGMTSGRVVSIDHADCFGNVTRPSEPTPVIVDIPGVPADLARDPSFVERAVTPIETMSDERLLETCACAAQGPAWGSDVRRRLNIAAWLAERKGKLRGMMEQWCAN